MNATSYYWSYIDFYILFTYTSLLLTITIMTWPPDQNSEAATKDVLKKHLCWSIFFTKLQAFRAATLLKKETSTQVFSCQIWKILKNTCFEEYLWKTASVYWLPYHILIYTAHYSTCFSFSLITSSLLHN